jgi:F0F1-type ATP synthase beta subunit
MNTGTVVQVLGPVIDVRFPDEIPAIYNALTVGIDSGDGQLKQVVCEVQQHLGDDKVRAVAMDSTDGLARGVEVVDTGVAMTATPSTTANSSSTSSAGRSTGRLRISSRSTRRTRSSRPASRSSTSSPRT